MGTDKVRSIVQHVARDAFSQSEYMWMSGVVLKALVRV